MKKGDFIEVEYTGKIKDGNIFDTTSEKIAKEAQIYGEKTKYGPVVVCLGEGHLLAGLEKELEGKKEGKHHISLSEENAFGKRQGKLLQLIPTKKLEQNNIRPIPGLQLNIDNMLAVVKTVSGGRTILDFNHPLAGKDVEYDLEVKRIVTDSIEQAKAVCSMELRLKPEISEKDSKLFFKGIPEVIHSGLRERIKELVKKDCVFDNEKKDAKKEEKKAVESKKE